MNLFTLALSAARHRRLASSLHLLLMMLGVAMMTALLLIGTEIENRLDRDADGIDMVIGAKGSPLQLILCAVYHLDIPTGNIPLAAADTWAHHPLVAEAIPISLGDNARGYRIVGTTPALLAHYRARFASGGGWQQPMQAVIGASVAAAGLRQGRAFDGVHGLAAQGHHHAGHPYTVVGVLAPTGTVADRLIFTSLESVWALHAAHHEAGPHDDDGDDDEPAPGAPREITSLLLRFRSPLAAAALPRMVNTQSNLQAAVPAFETARLLQLVGLGFEAARALALLLIAVAGLSVFVALYNAMEARQFDLAVYRSLGSTPAQVMLLLWLEAVALSGLGTVLGIALAHLAVEALGHAGATAQGIGLTGFIWLPEETWLLLVPFGLGTLAAALPAWRAYRVDVARVLAREGG